VDRLPELSAEEVRSLTVQVPPNLLVGSEQSDQGLF